MPPLNLKKTTILPTDQKSLAKSMFEGLVDEEPHVLLVVLGKGADAETFVQRADKMSGKPDEPRWVCWARKPEHIQEVVARLTGGAQLATRLDTTRGFSLSLSDEVRDEVKGSEPVPGLMRVNLCYTRAEKKDA